MRGAGRSAIEFREGCGWWSRCRSCGTAHLPRSNPPEGPRPAHRDPLHHYVNGDERGGGRLHGRSAFSTFGLVVGRSDRPHRSHRSWHGPCCSVHAVPSRTRAARRRCRTRLPTPRALRLLSSWGRRRKALTAACDSQRSKRLTRPGSIRSAVMAKSRQPLPACLFDDAHAAREVGLALLGSTVMCPATMTMVRSCSAECLRCQARVVVCSCRCGASHPVHETGVEAVVAGTRFLLSEEGGAHPA